MPELKVDYYKNGNTLSEIYQSVQTKFAFATENGGKIIQSHEWIQCRDFLHDAVRSMLVKESAPVFGFEFKSKVNPPINLKKTQLLVSQKGLKNGRKFRKDLRYALKMINYYESLIGIKNTTIKKVPGDKSQDYKFVWLLTGPKFWISAPHLISLYTLLLRLGAHRISFKSNDELKDKFKQISKLEKDKASNDTSYLKTLHDKIDSIILNNNKIIDDSKDGFSSLYFDNIGITSFHNRSGILSTVKQTTWSTELNEKMKTVFDKEN